METKLRAGYVSIVGRPNVGKSTLLNHLLEQKISITSKKRQTTRHNIVGIRSDDDSQLIFVDTPGMHQGQDSAINRYMNRTAGSALVDVDVIVFVVDKDTFTAEDEAVAKQLQNTPIPLILAINKIDQLSDSAKLLPHVQRLNELLPKAEIMPISALRDENLSALLDVLKSFVPESEELIYPEDQVTDRSLRFLAAEIVREKVIRLTGAELPYQSTVEIEQFEEKSGLVTISAVILVEREGQKRIVIGEKGSRIKQVGIDARRDIENLIDCQVMLNIWVKVKTGWSDDDRALRSLGFDD
ncbi:GTPase Era [Agaribacterium sp. ZY112]|uniref:GTPase Era n=1 Tax=Agaribacterium sp. ZY112 TaxID=3233574 RepID=UPI0035256DB2